MARSGRMATLDETITAGDRLDALRLRAGASGWVPPPVEPDSAAASRLTPVTPEPNPVPPAVAPPAIDALARAWAQDRMPVWAHGWIERLRFRTLLSVLAAVVVLIVGAVLVWHHGSSGGYSSSYDASAAGSPVAGSPAAADPQPSAVIPTTGSATSIVVDVGGRVRKPGLVTLPAGSRVADALAAAGGPLRRKEIATLNLAARVTDGQLLLVGVAARAAGPTATSADGSDEAGTAAGAGPVDLDSATVDQLETLPGVGPATAQKIIDWRTANNGFTSVAQLQQVPGIGPVKFGELSPLVTP